MLQPNVHSGALRVLACLLVIISSGCSLERYLRRAPEQVLKIDAPPGAQSAAESWRVKASVKQTVEHGWASDQTVTDLDIDVDGKSVIQGPLRPDFSGELDVDYQGHKLTAVCWHEQRDERIPICMLLVDERRALKLEFTELAPLSTDPTANPIDY